MKYKAKVTFAKLITVTCEFEFVVDDDELNGDFSDDETIYNAAYEQAAQIETEVDNLSVDWKNKLYVGDDLQFVSVKAAEEPFEVEVLEEI